jgi:hypothetical protein
MHSRAGTAVAKSDAVARSGMMLRVTRLAALLASTLVLWACPCPGPEDQIFLIHTPADADTQPLIDRCLDPTLKDCLPLCRKVSGINGNIVHCEIHMQTDPAFIQVHVGSQALCGA